MKKIFSSFLLIVSVVVPAFAQQQQQVSQHSLETYSHIFEEIQTLLEADGDTFWSQPLAGPILLIDPQSRAFVANENNEAKQFSQSNGVFVDTLPADVLIANTAVNWEGKRWTMVMLPLPKTQKARNNLIIHELFHRIQPEIGFGNIPSQPNDHLDEYKGRLLLRIELEALVQAIQSTGEERMAHIENALNLRSLRQTAYESKHTENLLELNEGLAEYTGVMLSGRSKAEMQSHFRQSVHHFYQNKTFVRSFAYQTIPMYGYLLSHIKPVWHREITLDTKLTDYFAEAFSVQIDSHRSLEVIANNHDYQFEEIQKEERLREEKRQQQLAHYKELFLEKPTLTLGFENMRISFDPNNVVPIESVGSVYHSLQVTDSWGILTVEKGALLGANWQHVIVTEPQSLTDRLISGDGWKLELNEGWEVVKGEEGYELRGKD